MISASYTRIPCNYSYGHRYSEGYIMFDIGIFDVKECWSEMKERILSSRYMHGCSSMCPGCLSVARGHALVLALLLYKLGLLDGLELER
jgi:hypothetical protein